MALTTRTQEVEGTIERHLNNDEHLLETISPEKRMAFTQRLENLRAEKRANLEFTDAAATVLFAMNSPEIVGEEKLLENIKEVPSREEIKKVADSTEIVLNTVTEVVKRELEKSVDKAQERIAILGKDEAPQDRAPKEGEATGQEKADAIIGLANETPIISNIIMKKTPVFMIIEGIKEVQKSIEDPKKDSVDVMLKLGEVLLDLKTLGFAGFLVDFLKKKEEGKKP